MPTLANFFLVLLFLPQFYASIVLVNPNGSGNFTNIADAISSAPSNINPTLGFHIIQISKGIFFEYLVIPDNKTNLMMVGAGINKTIISGNHSQGDNWNTFDSATIAIYGKNFVGKGITFRNTAGPNKEQAVAVQNKADQSAFYQCSFEGFQDTLLTNQGRQYYRECHIYGTIDVIFGFASSVFQNCNIYIRLPIFGQSNVVTAQGRMHANTDGGIVIHNCTITAASDLANANYSVKTFLGRPWKPYSRTVYIQSFMDTLIAPRGWLEMKGKKGLTTLYYAEYQNRGPGASLSQRVTWPGFHKIKVSEAMTFTVANFINGGDWLPATGIPYYPNLM